VVVQVADPWSRDQAPGRRRRNGPRDRWTRGGRRPGQRSSLDRVTCGRPCQL